MTGRAIVYIRSTSRRWLNKPQAQAKYHFAATTRRSLASAPNYAAPERSVEIEGLPDSIRRVNQAEIFPNEYPGQVYKFNWCLNGDGVTPLRKSAFRITKPLDMKIAGLTLPKKTPLKVKAADASAIPEAGSDALSFEQFDEVNQKTRDLLSLSDHLYCPEGHVPGTHTTVRVITNSPTLAPNAMAYLSRAPRLEPPVSLSITAYVLEAGGETEGAAAFAGYAIEEIEVPIPLEGENPLWRTMDFPEREYEAKSVASVVVVGQKPDLKVVVAGLELCSEALAKDEAEREAKKEAEEKQA